MQDQDPLESRLFQMFSRHERQLAQTAGQPYRADCPAKPRLQADSLSAEERLHVAACPHCQKMIKLEPPPQLTFRKIAKWAAYAGAVAAGIALLHALPKTAWSNVFSWQEDISVSRAKQPPGSKISAPGNPTDVELMTTLGAGAYRRLNSVRSEYCANLDEAARDNLDGNTLQLAKLIGARSAVKIEQVRCEMYVRVPQSTREALASDDLQLAQLLGARQFYRLAQVRLQMAGRLPPERLVDESRRQVRMASGQGAREAIRFAKQQLKEMESEGMPN